MPNAKIMSDLNVKHELIVESFYFEFYTAIVAPRKGMTVCFVSFAGFQF